MNMTFDTYLSNAGIDNKQFKEDVKAQAADQAKQELALDAWAAHYGIEANDVDILGEFIKAGIENPVEVQKQWLESGRLYLIREGVVRAKAMDDILEKAIVKEVDPSEKVEENDSEKKEQSE
jgi:trigger factor